MLKESKSKSNVENESLHKFKYVIEADWFFAWKSYISNDTSEKYTKNKNLRISLNKKIGVLPPSRINNEKFFNSNNNNNRIYSDLNLNEDYILVTYEIWEFFKRNYGGSEVKIPFSSKSIYDYAYDKEDNAHIKDNNAYTNDIVKETNISNFNDKIKNNDNNINQEIDIKGTIIVEDIKPHNPLDPMPTTSSQSKYNNDMIRNKSDINIKTFSINKNYEEYPDNLKIKKDITNRLDTNTKIRKNNSSVIGLNNFTSKNSFIRVNNNFNTVVLNSKLSPQQSSISNVINNNLRNKHNISRNNKTYSNLNSNDNTNTNNSININICNKKANISSNNLDIKKNNRSFVAASLTQANLNNNLNNNIKESSIFNNNKNINITQEKIISKSNINNMSNEDKIKKKNSSISNNSNSNNNNSSSNIHNNNSINNNNNKLSLSKYKIINSSINNKDKYNTYNKKEYCATDNLNIEILKDNEDSKGSEVNDNFKMSDLNTNFIFGNKDKLEDNNLKESCCFTNKQYYGNKVRNKSTNAMTDSITISRSILYSDVGKNKEDELFKLESTMKNKEIHDQETNANLNHMKYQENDYYSFNDIKNSKEINDDVVDVVVNKNIYGVGKRAVKFSNVSNNNSERKNYKENNTNYNINSNIASSNKYSGNKKINPEIFLTDYNKNKKEVEEIYSENRNENYDYCEKFLINSNINHSNKHGHQKSDSKNIEISFLGDTSKYTTSYYIIYIML